MCDLINRKSAIYKSQMCDLINRKSAIYKSQMCDLYIADLQFINRKNLICLRARL